MRDKKSSWMSMLSPYKWIEQLSTTTHIAPLSRVPFSRSIWKNCRKIQEFVLSSRIVYSKELTLHIFNVTAAIIIYLFFELASMSRFGVLLKKASLLTVPKKKSPSLVFFCKDQSCMIINTHDEVKILAYHFAHCLTIPIIQKSWRQVHGPFKGIYL